MVQSKQMRDQHTREGREDDLCASTFDGAAVVTMEIMRLSDGFQPHEEVLVPEAEELSLVFQSCFYGSSFPTNRSLFK